MPNAYVRQSFFFFFFFLNQQSIKKQTEKHCSGNPETQTSTVAKQIKTGNVTSAAVCFPADIVVLLDFHNIRRWQRRHKTNTATSTLVSFLSSSATNHKAPFYHPCAVAAKACGTGPWMELLEAPQSALYHQNWKKFVRSILDFNVPSNSEGSPQDQSHTHSSILH